MLWNCINVFTKQFLPKENHSTWATDTQHPTLIGSFANDLEFQGQN